MVIDVNNNLPVVSVLATNTHHGINIGDLFKDVSVQLSVDDIHFHVSDEVSLRWIKYPSLEASAPNEADTGDLTPAHTIAATDIRKPITLPVSGFLKPELLTKLSVYYVLSSSGGSQKENSPGTDVYIKASRPGGANGEGLHPPQLPAEIVSAKNVLTNAQKAAGINVTIPAYQNMSVHDRISLVWGNQYLDVREVTAAEVGKDIIIRVPADKITAAGLGDINVYYFIMDYVENRSAEPDRSISVRVGEDGATQFKPIFMDAEADILDLRKIKGETFKVIVPYEALTSALGKVVELSGNGYTKPLTDPSREIVLEASFYSVPGKKVDADAMKWGMIFELPKVLLQNSSVNFYDARYTIIDKDLRPSLPASVHITGHMATGILPAPVVDGVIITAGLAELNIDEHPITTITIKYPDMKQGDIVSLFWRGPAGNDLPIGTPQLVAAGQSEITFANVKTDIWTTTAVILFYSVQRTGTASEQSAATTFTIKSKSFSIIKAKVMGWGTPQNYDLCEHEALLLKPTDIHGQKNFCMIAGHYDSHLAIENGILVAWGSNNLGQLGCGDYINTQKKRICTISGAPNMKFKFVSTGISHSLAIDENNCLWGAGYQVYGLLGNGVSTGSEPVFKRSSSSVKFMLVDAGGSVKADQRASIGISVDHKLYTWGQNHYGILGSGQKEEVSITIPTQIYANKSDWVFATINYYNAAAIDLEGNLFVWGKNKWSQLTTNFPPDQVINAPTRINILDPDTGIPVKWSKIAISYRPTLAIDKQGRLWSWGQNCMGLVGHGHIDQYYAPSILLDRQGGKPWLYVSASNFACAAIDGNGMLWTWGFANFGQMGHGDKSQDWAKPEIVPVSSGWMQIVAGTYHMIGLYQ